MTHFKPWTRTGVNFPELKRGWSSEVIHSGRDGNFKGSYATQSTVKESLAGNKKFCEHGSVIRFQII